MFSPPGSDINFLFPSVKGNSKLAEYVDRHEGTTTVRIKETTSDDKLRVTATDLSMLVLLK